MKEKDLLPIQWFHFGICVCDRVSALVCVCILSILRMNHTWCWCELLKKSSHTIKSLDTSVHRKIQVMVTWRKSICKISSILLLFYFSNVLCLKIDGLWWTFWMRGSSAFALQNAQKLSFSSLGLYLPDYCLKLWNIHRKSVCVCCVCQNIVLFLFVCNFLRILNFIFYHQNMCTFSLFRSHFRFVSRSFYRTLVHALALCRSLTCE